MAKILKIGKKKFDFDVYQKLLKRGLSCGMTNGKKQVCIEAAVSIALGESTDPKGRIDFRDNLGIDDAPSCVNSDLAGCKIALNDRRTWKSPQSRARGLRELGIAQLGTDRKSFDFYMFQDRVLNVLDTKKNEYSLEGYICEKNCTSEKDLILIADTMVKVLKEMKTPGSKYLYLLKKKKR